MDTFKCYFELTFIIIIIEYLEMSKILETSSRVNEVSERFPPYKVFCDIVSIWMSIFFLVLWGFVRPQINHVV